MTSDACGAATLVVEARGERIYLWRKWHAENFPFVCALLEEMGKPVPFRNTEAAARHAEPATALHKQAIAGRRGHWARR